VCRDLERQLEGCILGAISALEPHSIIDVRYSTSTNKLLIQFGDSVTGQVDLKQLGLDDQIDALLLETATVGDRGGAVEIVRRDGELFEIDAEAIRAITDAGFASLLASEAKRSDKKIGEHVRSARISARLTQLQVSKKTGIDQAIISKLERGLHQPRVDTLERIAIALGISISELLTGTQA
jgi:DNA-binding XRE family transcriptional regulator